MYLEIESSQMQLSQGPWMRTKGGSQIQCRGSLCEKERETDAQRHGGGGRVKTGQDRSKATTDQGTSGAGGDKEGLSLRASGVGPC